MDRTLSDRVYEHVIAKIIDGTFSIGAKLPTEQDLSKELGVSRPVLRDALKQLREEGVIVSRRGSGSYVNRKPDSAVLHFAPVGSIADIQRVFEFRAAIESGAAYHAAERRTESDLIELKQSLDDLDKCVQEGILGVEEDEQFHFVVSNASKNQYFSNVHTSMKSIIMTGMNLTRNLSLRRPIERLELVQAEHYAIFDAIYKQDAKQASSAMREHIENARHRVFEGDSHPKE